MGSLILSRLDVTVIFYIEKLSSIIELSKKSQNTLPEWIGKAIQVKVVFLEGRKDIDSSANNGVFIILYPVPDYDIGKVHHLETENAPEVFQTLLEMAKEKMKSLL